MKKNMGAIDRLLRLVVALLMIILYFRGVLEGVLGIVLIVVSIIFVITSLVSFCPLYTIFGMNSCPKEKRK